MVVTSTADALGAAMDASSPAERSAHATLRRSKLKLHILDDQMALPSFTASPKCEPAVRYGSKADLEDLTLAVRNLGAAPDPTASLGHLKADVVPIDLAHEEAEALVSF